MLFLTQHDTHAAYQSYCWLPGSVMSAGSHRKNNNPETVDKTLASWPVHTVNAGRTA